MPKIRFLETRTVKDGTGTTFEAGKAYELPEASCARWKLRNVAEDAAANSSVSLPLIFGPNGSLVEQEQPVAVVAEPEGEGEGEQDEALVEIPKDWADLHHATRKKLAKLISGEDAENTEAADAVIAAEIARRAADEGDDDEGEGDGA